MKTLLILLVSLLPLVTEASKIYGSAVVTEASKLYGSAVVGEASPTISLAGQWHFALDPDSTLTPSSRFDDVVTLPGTTDTNQKGIPLSRFDETTHLSRRYSYKGRAWYSREIDIPKDWADKKVTLLLERTKYTEVYLEGQLIGSCNDISTPQVFTITPHYSPLQSLEASPTTLQSLDASPTTLTPGRHVLTIMVDNGSHLPNQLYASSHACTEDTQTNWNGIIGRIELRVESSGLSAEISGLATVDTDAAANYQLSIINYQFSKGGHRIFLRGKHDACVWPLTGHVPMDVPSWLDYLGTCADYGINHVRFHSWCPPEAAFVAADSLDIILQPELPFWGDFNDKDTLLMNFLHKEGENILRWYGHHKSFRMFALGNELWGSIDKMQEFIDDFRRIAPDKLYTYGSNYYLGYQPPLSFGEGTGVGSPLSSGEGPGMDYFTTCRVGGEAWGSYDTHTRGSFSFADAYEGGMINHFRPNAKMNFEEGCTRSSVPVISHETGQFQTYPDYNEIEKYTGVLRPCNMEVFRRRLEQAGMADQAEAFHRASGRWSYLLYKQDIEMDLRTPNMAGFQLLDLQDYPGQGSAYVGILDAFMQPKGICTREEWRQFCSPVVPLLVCDAYCFTFSEGIHGKVQVANYSGGSLYNNKVYWQCAGQQGEMTIPEGEGLLDIGSLDIDLSHLKKASQLKLTLTVCPAVLPQEPAKDGRPLSPHPGELKGANTYDLWAYPDNVKLDKQGLIIAKSLTDDVIHKLQKGAKVLLMPKLEGICNLRSDLCVGGLFQTDYWNYRMFKTICENNKKPVSPGTLGLLCDPQHPLFRDFPTEEHTSWQWWAVVKESHPFILDNLSFIVGEASKLCSAVGEASKLCGAVGEASKLCGAVGEAYRPLVQVIDNVERNHKLGLVFEFQVGKGRLLVVMSDLDKASEYPEGRQFYASVLNYMHSKDFTVGGDLQSPTLTPDQLRLLFSTKVSETQLQDLNNISPY